MSSGNFHVNANGEVGKCSAKIECPFGGEDKHYSSVFAARDAYETEQSANALKSVSKPKSKLDPLSYMSGPSQRFTTNHGFSPWNDIWKSFQVPNGDKLHVVIGEEKGQEKYFYAKKDKKNPEFTSPWETPKEITREAAEQLGYTDPQNI